MPNTTFYRGDKRDNLDREGMKTWEYKGGPTQNFNFMLNSSKTKNQKTGEETFPSPSDIGQYLTSSTCRQCIATSLDTDRAMPNEREHQYRIILDNDGLEFRRLDSTHRYQSLEEMMSLPPTVDFIYGERNVHYLITEKGAAATKPKIVIFYTSSSGASMKMEGSFFCDIPVGWITKLR